MRYISKESKGANRCNNSRLHSQRDMVGTTCLLTEACLNTKLCYVSSPFTCNQLLFTISLRKFAYLYTVNILSAILLSIFENLSK